MLDSKLVTKLLFATAALSAAGFGVLSVAVARGKTSRFDRHSRRRVHGLRVDSEHPQALRNAALATTPLGKVVGGYFAGVALGATCAGLYELSAHGGKLT